MQIRAALSLLLLASISCQSFEYYGANMTSAPSNQYPQTILYSKLHPTIACTVYNSTYFAIFQYAGTGYIMFMTIKANGTTTSCTVSYDCNTMFLLINSTVIKVFTRSSNGGSFSLFTTLTGVQTTSKQLQSNSNGSLLGTIVSGTTVHIWTKNGSIYSPYNSTIVSSGLIDFRFRSDDRIVIATTSNIQVPLRDFNSNYVTVTLPSSINTTKMDMSLNGSVIVIADKYSKTQIFVTDSLQSSCSPVRTLLNSSSVLQMLKVSFDGSAFTTIDNTFTRRSYFSTQKNNSADTNPT